MRIQQDASRRLFPSQESAYETCAGNVDTDGVLLTFGRLLFRSEDVFEVNLETPDVAMVTVSGFCWRELLVFPFCFPPFNGANGHYEESAAALYAVILCGICERKLRAAAD